MDDLINFKKDPKTFFLSYGTLKIWAFKYCKQDISNTILAIALELYRLIKNDK